MKMTGHRTGSGLPALSSSTPACCRPPKRAHCKADANSQSSVKVSALGENEPAAAAETP
jgi:hypothetical protein